MLTLLALFGIMSGLFLYEYTDFFDLLKTEIMVPQEKEFSIELCLSLYYDEVKLLGLLFICGFTLFSPYISVAVLIYKGFMTGFSTLFFGMQYQSGSLSSRNFQIICALLILTLVIYIIMAAKSMLFGSMLKYAAPDIASLLKQRISKRYILTFLLLAGFLALSTVIKYTVS